MTYPLPDIAHQEGVIRHGLTGSAVTVRTVREPGRLTSGKTRRFIPLAPEV